MHLNTGNSWPRHSSCVLRGTCNGHVSAKRHILISLYVKRIWYVYRRRVLVTQAQLRAGPLAQRPGQHCARARRLSTAAMQTSFQHQTSTKKNIQVNVTRFYCTQDGHGLACAGEYKFSVNSGLSHMQLLASPCVTAHDYKNDSTCDSTHLQLSLDLFSCQGR
jgi:hypothetical protein